MAFNGSEINASALSENELIRRVKDGDDAAFEELTVRYLSVILAKASAYRCIRTDLDDFIQEGMLALLKSAQAYNPDGGASFATYASCNIDRRFFSVYRKETRKKDFPKDKLVPMEETDSEQAAQIADPEQELINKEAYRSLMERIQKKLSTLEQNVFDCYVSGMSLKEISESQNIPFKSVDNALQRIRKKLR